MSQSDVIAKNNKWVPVKREKTTVHKVQGCEFNFSSS